jgi:hypothetical protein
MVPFLLVKSLPLSHIFHTSLISSSIVGSFASATSIKKHKKAKAKTIFFISSSLHIFHIILFFTVKYCHLV